MKPMLLAGVVAVTATVSGCSTVGPNSQAQIPSDSDAAMITYLKAEGISKAEASQPMPMAKWQMFGAAPGWYICARDGQELPTAYVFDGYRVIGSIPAKADRSDASEFRDPLAPKTLPICDGASYHRLALS